VPTKWHCTDGLSAAVNAPSDRSIPAEVRLRGEVDLSTAPWLSEILTKAATATDSDLMVDLGRLAFMDATGLRVLLKACTETRARRQELILVGARGPVARILELTGLSERMSCVGLSRLAAVRD
jgi:anti-anti-sigma factor